MTDPPASNQSSLSKLDKLLRFCDFLLPPLLVLGIFTNSYAFLLVGLKFRPYQAFNGSAVIVLSLGFLKTKRTVDGAELPQSEMTLPPTPTLIPDDGVPDGALDKKGQCWWGCWSEDLNKWIWIYESGPPFAGSTHYLPHDVAFLPTKAPPTP